MTVSRATTLLYSFCSKVEESLSLVPRMCPEEKLKAVQFWNTISEKLQDIVNSSAADIHAIALKMGEEEENKMNIDISNDISPVEPQQCLQTSEFLSIHSNYSDVDDGNITFSSPNYENNQLKQELSPNSFLSNHSATNLPSESNVQSLVPSSHHTINDENENIDQLYSSQTLSNDCEPFPTNAPATNILISANQSLNQASVEIQRQKHPLKTSPKKKCSLPKCSTSKKQRRTSSRKSNVCVEKTGNLRVDISDSSKDSDFEISQSESMILDDINDSNSSQSDSEDHLNKSMPCDIEDNICDDFTCKLCQKEFPDDESLNSHSKTHDHEKRHSCQFCRTQFTSRGNLIVHERRHTGERPYSCENCNARFSTRGNLKRHLHIHSGERPWKCDHCNMAFTEKKTRNVHMRRHTGEKPYKCKVCGKVFAQPGILQTHMAVHLDMRIHLCELCGKSFRQKSQLRVHKMRHDNIRKHGCDTCASSFLTKADLERHSRIHTGEKPFTCKECSKTFTRQQTLNEHMNRHYGIKPYVCRYCNKEFVEMSACYKHIKQHEKPSDAEKESLNRQNQKRLTKSSKSKPNKSRSFNSSMSDKEIEMESTEYDIAFLLNVEDVRNIRAASNSLSNQLIMLDSAENRNKEMTALNLLSSVSREMSSTF